MVGPKMPKNGGQILGFVKEHVDGNKWLWVKEGELSDCGKMAAGAGAQLH